MWCFVKKYNKNERRSKFLCIKKDHLRMKKRKETKKEDEKKEKRGPAAIQCSYPFSPFFFSLISLISGHAHADK
jgi:hypothetical protein